MLHHNNVGPLDSSTHESSSCRRDLESRLLSISRRWPQGQVRFDDVSKFTAQVGQNFSFIPITGRWQKVWSVRLSAHLWHDSALDMQTLTEADGKVGWGVYGSTWAYRDGGGAGRSGGGIGKFTIAGRVVDSNGNGVADLGLQVGKQTVYIGATTETTSCLAQKNPLAGGDAPRS